MIVCWDLDLEVSVGACAVYVMFSLFPSSWPRYPSKGVQQGGTATHLGREEILPRNIWRNCHKGCDFGTYYLKLFLLWLLGFRQFYFSFPTFFGSFYVYSLCCCIQFFFHQFDLKLSRYFGIANSVSIACSDYQIFS